MLVFVIKLIINVFIDKKIESSIRDRPFNLQEGGGYGFLFRS